MSLITMKRPVIDVLEPKTTLAALLRRNPNTSCKTTNLNSNKDTTFLFTIVTSLRKVFSGLSKSFTSLNYFQTNLKAPRRL
jgi:hypothetical protein